MKFNMPNVNIPSSVGQTGSEIGLVVAKALFVLTGLGVALALSGQDSNPTAIEVTTLPNPQIGETALPPTLPVPEGPTAVPVNPFASEWSIELKPGVVLPDGMHCFRLDDPDTVAKITELNPFSDGKIWVLGEDGNIEHIDPENLWGEISQGEIACGFGGVER